MPKLDPSFSPLPDFTGFSLIFTITLCKIQNEPFIFVTEDVLFHWAEMFLLFRSHSPYSLCSSFFILYSLFICITLYIHTSNLTNDLSIRFTEQYYSISKIFCLSTSNFFSFKWMDIIGSDSSISPPGSSPGNNGGALVLTCFVFNFTPFYY